MPRPKYYTVRSTCHVVVCRNSKTPRRYEGRRYKTIMQPVLSKLNYPMQPVLLVHYYFYYQTLYSIVYVGSTRYSTQPSPHRTPHTLQIQHKSIMTKQTPILPKLNMRNISIPRPLKRLRNLALLPRRKQNVRRHSQDKRGNMRHGTQALD